MDYFKLAFWVCGLLAIAAQDFYWYNKGKDSGFSSVLAGVSTTQAKEEKAVTVDVQQATADATKLANLERDKNDLQKKLKALAAANPQPACKLDPDSLSSLQAIAGATKP